MLRYLARPLRRLLDLLIPIAVVLLILFLIVRSWTINHVKEEDLAAEAATAAVQDLSAIVSFSFYNGSETLAFTMKEDGKWYWINETFPLDQDTMGDFVSLLSSYTPSVVVAEGEDLNLETYDLSTPLYTLSFTTAGGDTTSYHFGKSIDTGGTYMRLAPSGTVVYMAPSSLSALVKKGLYDFCLADSFPFLSADNISQITLTTAEKKIIYTRSGKEGEGAARWLSIGRDVTENGTFLAVMDNLSTLRFEKCLVWDPVEESFGICGLADPALTLTVEYSDPNQREAQLELRIGDKRSDTEYFATWSAANAIYAISKDTIGGLLAAAGIN